MSRSNASVFLLFAGAAALSPLAFAGAAEPSVDPVSEDVTQGALRVKTETGVVECPLRHTDVQARISGFLARVRVTQTFHNPLDEKIEAVYVFPLPHRAAVDDMTMVIGERRIVGVVRRRAEARAAYERALLQGLTACLLEQERPNIFTQSVGNIGPGQEILVEISYLDVLTYDMGTYEFHFPMVVGPRYIPGRPISTVPGTEGKPAGGTGWSPDTDRVRDASRITPPVQRNGHDISLSVTLDAGVPIQGLRVLNHKAEPEQLGGSKATVILSPADSIPNKDFVLRYDVAGERPEMALLCHTDESGEGYFMLMVQPADDERLRERPPREMCFLIDVSGSMSGAPMAKVREAMFCFLESCREEDTFQVITFAHDTRKLFEKALPATPGKIAEALTFTRGLRGGGGTEMLNGVRTAVKDPLDPVRDRVVVMLTDGLVGNEAEIIEEVGRSGDRVRFWCVGIGGMPNRFLADGVARQGGGMAKILGLDEDPQALVQEVMFRIHRAQLANVNVEWRDVSVWETYPTMLPELWAGRPVILFGRYEGGGREAVVNVTGEIGREPASWPLSAWFPACEPENDVLAGIWARWKIEELMHQTFYRGSPEVEEEVAELALLYGLMSRYTSFVAVDEGEAGQTDERARPPRRMVVPVPIPDRTTFVDYDVSGAFFAPVVGRLFDGAPRAMGAGPSSAGRRGAAGGGPRAAAALPMALVTGTGRIGPLSAPREERRGRLVVMQRAGPDVAYARARPGDLVQRARATLRLAEGLRRRGALKSARARFAFAYFLDAACANKGLSAGDVARVAVASIEELNARLARSWAREMPALEKKLDCVIRDKSLGEALKAVADAAGISVSLLPGSVEDVRAIVKSRDLRVGYLDLRGATVAQALDWTLRSARMTSWVEKGTIVAGSCRRGPGHSAWVYDVSLIALPSAEEMKEKESLQGRVEPAMVPGDEFLEGVQRVLPPSENASWLVPGKLLAVGNAMIPVTIEEEEDEFLSAVRKEFARPGRAAWFAPGQLLVFGNAKAHAAVAELLADLADPDAEPPQDLAQLHRVTSARAGEGRGAAATALAARERAYVLESVERFSWPLLAAAAGGELDVEALTELRLAWRHPEAVELLQGADALPLLRSLWALTESSAALPEEAELTELAASVRERSRRAAEEALAEPPGDGKAFFRALYAALALRDDPALLARARALLTRERDGEVKLPGAGTLAAALLKSPGAAERRALAEFVSRGGEYVEGEDMVVLTALACRRGGGEAWKAFRREARAILGRQPLPGSVVVLVNRLGRPRLVLLTGAGGR